MAKAAQMEMARKKLDASLAKIKITLPKTTLSGFRSWGMQTLSRFKATRLSSSSRSSLGVRTGDLRRSFVFVCRGEKLKDIEGRFQTRSKYAAIHEHGGVVRAKSGKFLRVPIKNGPALTPAGVNRYHGSFRRSAPSDHSFYVIRSDSGNLLLMGKKKKSGAKPKPWYTLVKSVTIPKRMGFLTAIKSRLNDLKRVMNESAKDVVEK